MAKLFQDILYDNGGTKVVTDNLKPKDRWTWEALQERAQDAPTEAEYAQDLMKGYSSQMNRFMSRDPGAAERERAAYEAAQAEKAKNEENLKNDTLSYGQAKEEEARLNVRNQIISKIADIENKIADLDGQIEELEKPLEKKGLSERDLYKKIAANEMRKWNSSDPTSFWRWEKGREDAKDKEIRDEERLKKEKEKAENKARENVKYTVEASLSKMNPNRKGYNRNDQNRWLDELAALKADARKHGDFESLKKIAAKEREIGGDISTPEEQASDVMIQVNDIMNKVGKEGGYSKEEARQMLEDIRTEHGGLLNSVNSKLVEELSDKIAKLTKNKPAKQPGGNPFG